MVEQMERVALLVTAGIQDLLPVVCQKAVYLAV
jgi:hypothetical protein